MEEKLLYQFNSDTRLLNQYFRLRKIIYAEELSLEIPEHKDQFDDISHIIIIKHKSKCVGGARITQHIPLLDNFLPMENENFRLSNIFPELTLENESYVEFSKLILMTDYRDTKVTERLYTHMNRKVRQLGARYIFVIAGKLHARRYLRSYHKLGFNASIKDDIAIPLSIQGKYNNLAECIIVLDMLKDRDILFRHNSLHVNNITEAVFGR